LSPGKLVLFDIDGTLLTAGRAPRRAISKALLEVYGIEDDLRGIPPTTFAGKTDPEIVRAILLRNADLQEDWKEKLPSFFRVYTRTLEEELRAEKKARLYPGVKELLDTLNESGEVVLGVLTGNIRDGARLKLEHFGLWKYFSVGSYGSDSCRRNDLPGIALERVRSETGREFSGKDVVIIGDTFDDIRASREINSKSLIVATGFFPYEELLKEKPDYIFRDLSNTSEVVEAIMS